MAVRKPDLRTPPADRGVSQEAPPLQASSPRLHSVAGYGAPDRNFYRVGGQDDPEGNPSLYKQNVRLQNSDKSHRMWLSLPEADRLLKAGEIVRITRAKDPNQVYRMKWFPEPSDANETSPMITPSDVKRLVGLQKVDEVKIERLIGFHLLPEGTQVPENGYL